MIVNILKDLGSVLFRVCVCVGGGGGGGGAVSNEFCCTLSSVECRCTSGGNNEYEVKNWSWG